MVHQPRIRTEIKAKESMTMSLKNTEYRFSSMKTRLRPYGLQKSNTHVRNESVLYGTVGSYVVIVKTDTHLSIDPDCLSLRYPFVLSISMPSRFVFSEKIILFWGDIAIFGKPTFRERFGNGDSNSGISRKIREGWQACMIWTHLTAHTHSDYVMWNTLQISFVESDWSIIFNTI